MTSAIYSYRGVLHSWLGTLAYAGSEGLGATLTPSECLEVHQLLMRLDGPDDGPSVGPSVGPWKECVYKHPDAPKEDAFSKLATLIGDIEIDRYGKPLRAALHLCNDLADEIDRLRATCVPSSEEK